jgi:serine/tyrosine/threonine adenylyltransferase
LIKDAVPLQNAINHFWQQFESSYQTMMAQKLGISRFNGSTDQALISDLQELLAAVETDYSIFFRQLAQIDVNAFLNKKIDVPILKRPLATAYYQTEQLTFAFQEKFDRWLEQYAVRIHQDDLSDAERIKLMNRVNPKYVLRNYLAQQAIEQAETGDYTLIHDLMDLLRHPYDEHPGQEHFAQKRPDWARTKPGCSMLSCSS